MKKLIVILLCVSLITILIACKSTDTDNESSVVNSSEAASEESSADTAESSDSSEASEADSGFEYGLDYITENLGDIYSITYQIINYSVDSEPETTTIEIARNEEGCYINFGEDYSLLYVKDGDAYAMCLKDEETGDFVKVPETTVDEEDIDLTASLMLLYMAMYEDYAEELESDGTATVCERDCDKFILESDFFEDSTKVEFYIDKATGVCLKLTFDSSESIEDGYFEFECTSFSLEDVVLPAYTE
ncbi:MAG: hypothetical protein PHW77_07740 [Eubacteriales bacterium]|nr:hypothetical protein [Eubacteriales bacterium]